MKKIKLIGLALSLTISLNAGQNENGDIGTNLNLSSYPIYTLTTEQINDMKFMYEEEQVARDVYNYLYVKWGVEVFSNIAKSEQKHMDAIGTLLERYSIPKPVINEKAGVFNNQTLQQAYNDLIARGSMSIINALNVGVEIETMDIKDLESATIKATDDVKVVYEKLKNASYNHLNSFNLTLKSLNITTTTSLSNNEFVSDLKNTTQNIGWYFWMTDSGKAYLASGRDGEIAVWNLTSERKWRPIHNAGEFDGFSSAGKNFNSVNISSDGRTISFY